MKFRTAIHCSKTAGGEGEVAEEEAWRPPFGTAEPFVSRSTFSVGPVPAGLPPWWRREFEDNSRGGTPGGFLSGAAPRRPLAAGSAPWGPAASASSFPSCCSMAILASPKKLVCSPMSPESMSMSMASVQSRSSNDRPIPSANGSPSRARDISRAATSTRTASAPLLCLSLWCCLLANSSPLTATALPTAASPVPPICLEVIALTLRGLRLMFCGGEDSLLRVTGERDRELEAARKLAAVADESSLHVLPFSLSCARRWSAVLALGGSTVAFAFALAGGELDTCSRLLLLFLCKGGSADDLVMSTAALLFSSLDCWGSCAILPSAL
mmetsp:Transcript_74674/g.177721  ORF Transcript_74674/g.177721 Transcript_74674/m.177721 type:complete len:326 (+) Transcript_74674:556-1533(+)